MATEASVDPGRWLGRFDELVGGSRAGSPGRSRGGGLALAFLTIATATGHAHPLSAGQIPLTRNEIAALSAR